ncbi:zinc-ribbon domain-containing protein [Enterobacteriaceae bacterium 89]|nr:zinc-ribbon domain-containing protein [Enterobacteriaceae bacterium 89]
MPSWGTQGKYMSTIDIKDDRPLVELLFNAEKSDLDLLIDYITDNGNGRISLSSSVKKLLVEAKENNEIDEDTLRVLIRELQLFGGNSFANLFRKNGVDYAEIVDDVLARLKIKAHKTASVERKESLIISKVFENAWDKMSDEDRKKILDSLGIKSLSSREGLEILLPRIGLGGIAAYQVTAIVASSVAAMVTGRVLQVAAGFGSGRVLGALAGPIGIALTGIYSVYDLANPAFRVTLPCIVQIAWIRMKSLQNLCDSCNHSLEQNAKFCPQCGTPVGA